MEKIERDSYIPVCDDSMKPIQGRRFPTLEAAINFYEEYARIVGFDTRSFSAKRAGNVVTYKYVVCNREGEKNATDADVENAQNGYVNKRRRLSARCGCKARVAFKYCSEFGSPYYIVHLFVEEHNHPFVEEQYKIFMKINRKMDAVHQKFVLDCAKVSIGPTLAHKLLNELLGGDDAIGCTVVEFRNFTRDMKAHIEGSDAQMLLNEMRRKKELCPAFTYAFEVDKDDKLKSLFWCDPVSRRNYHMFGDVIAFDTTYSTNKYCMIFAPFTGKDNHGLPVTFAAGLLSSEDADSFTWLFERFIDCMGAHPKLIITDQDLGMQTAITRVFVETRHRWCMWHIMLKVADKVSKELRANVNFKKELNDCVWSESIEPDVFEKAWGGIMVRYGLVGDDWFTSMYGSRKTWVPAYFRDYSMGCIARTTSISECENSFFKRYTKSRSNLVEFIMNFNHALESQRHRSLKLDHLDKTTIPVMATKVTLEKHAATLYTDRMFKVVQKEIVAACFQCRMTSMLTGGGTEHYSIADGVSDTFSVCYTGEDDSYICSCKLFMRVGVLCSHIFYVMKNKGLKSIPDKYVVGRWLKISSVKGVHDVESCDEFNDLSGVDDNQKLLKKLYSSFFSWVQKMDGDKDKICALTAALDDAGSCIVGNTPVSSAETKKKLLDDFYGDIPEDIDVHFPDKVKTKGSGRRLMSDKEKQIKKLNKPLRKCAKCLQMCHHDARNCNKVKLKAKKKD